jgi:hypothetical protein
LWWPCFAVGEEFEECCGDLPRAVFHGEVACLGQHSEVGARDEFVQTFGEGLSEPCVLLAPDDADGNLDGREERLELCGVVLV